MPSTSEPNDDGNRRRSQAEATKQIHQLALQALQIAEEAELHFLVYLIWVRVKACEADAGDVDPKPRHTEAYSIDGVCTNQAESYFSRLRRMIRGQHHHVSPKYIYQYAEHAAWIEDHRRLSNGVLASRALGLALSHRVSRNWKGYWQRAA